MSLKKNFDEIAMLGNRVRSFQSKLRQDVGNNDKYKKLYHEYKKKQNEMYEKIEDLIIKRERVFPGVPRSSNVRHSRKKKEGKKRINRFAIVEIKKRDAEIEEINAEIEYYRQKLNEIAIVIYVIELHLSGAIQQYIISTINNLQRKIDEETRHNIGSGKKSKKRKKQKKPRKKKN